MAARLKELYRSEVAPALMKKFEYKSVMQIPKLDKIVINVGCGEGGIRVCKNKECGHEF